MLQNDDMVLVIPRITTEWVAGFFDGEGSASSRLSGNSFSVDVSITQKDPKILILILMKYPGGNLSTKNSKLGTCYQMRWRGRTALPLLHAIKDYVIVKQRIVELCIELLNLVNETNIRIDEDNLSKRAKLSEKIRTLVNEGNISGA